MRRPTRNELGWALTFAWLIGVPAFALCVAHPKGWVKIPGDLNAWGDTAAGFFAPLAFLWLVLGYRQQGEELKQQAEELRQSVEAQKQMAKAQQEQLEHDRRVYENATLPRITVSPSDVRSLPDGKCQDTIKIHSHGMAAADAARVQWKLPFEDGMNLGIHFFGSEALGDIPGRSSREARVETPEEFEDIIIDFYYHDQHGDWHNQSLRHTHKHHQEATSFQLTDLGRMHRPKDFLDLGIKPYKVERN